jgi:hypothetical protein
VTELSELPPRERIKRYRDFAIHARREAQSSKGDLRVSFLTIADHWDRLATSIEVQLKSDPE